MGHNLNKSLMEKNLIEQFIDALTEAIDYEKEILLETSLEELDWDSLAIISTMAIASDKFNKVLDPELLAKCKTINEIILLIDNS